MSDTPAAFPLTWPEAFPRAKARERGQFKTALPAALKNVQTSLRLFASDSRKALANVVLSSNVTLGTSKPSDPGVAAWFMWDGLSVCIPVDRYETVEANLQAIHHVLEARRVELQHGTLALVRATMQGFIALPKPSGRKWWTVLGVTESAKPEQIEAAFRNLALARHPDRGGSDAMMAELNAARATALKERGSQ